MRKHPSHLHLQHKVLTVHPPIYTSSQNPFTANLKEQNKILLLLSVNPAASCVSWSLWKVFFLGGVTQGTIAGPRVVWMLFHTPPSLLPISTSWFTPCPPSVLLSFNFHYRLLKHFFSFKWVTVGLHDGRCSVLQLLACSSIFVVLWWSAGRCVAANRGKNKNKNKYFKTKYNCIN